VSTAGEDDIAPREYRQGDDLRRIHWRSTARYGELMVRREEQQWQSRGALFLDTRRQVHRGEGPGSTFEQAVSVAASVGVHLAHEGFSLRFVTDSGESPADAGGFEGALLDALSIARMSRNRSLAPGLGALGEAIGSRREGGGLVVAIFGALEPAEARSVAAIRRGTATCVAILVGGTQHDGDPRRGPDLFATEILRTAGWLVIMISTAAALATVWAHADQAPEETRHLPPTERGRP
jgi:hypothetical protein